MIPQSLYQHITIEDIEGLSEQEADMLLYICNVWAPIRPPMPTEEDPHPINLNMIRVIRKPAVLDRVRQAESIIKDEARLIYESLRNKFGIPVEKPPIVLTAETTGSVLPTTGSNENNITNIQ